MVDSRRLDFLRVLIAAAWADGELTVDELNNLKVYFRELGLANDELIGIELYLKDPIDAGEAETIIDDFLARASGKERETLIAAVRDLVLVDGELGEGERRFLAMLEAADGKTTTAGVFVAQLKRLWASRPAHPDARFRRSELVDEFVRNRVLYQVKRRLGVSGTALDAETERELRTVCAIAGLLGHVARADRRFDDDERATIAESLDGISTLQSRDVDVLVDIVRSDVLADAGYFSFVRELNELASMEDKRKILAMLFDLAAADAEITHDEHEEIRKISKALHLDHDAFIAAKLAAVQPRR